MKYVMFSVLCAVVFSVEPCLGSGGYSEVRANQLIAHVKKSIEMANLGRSKINNDVLGLDGMSAPKVRHFLNNLCSLREARYLEIGVWKGSTFISALYGNEKSMLEAIAIDNWSEFGGPKLQFETNLQKFLGSNSHYRFLEVDCFNIDLKLFKDPINIYFYDGNHSLDNQANAFTYYNAIFDDIFIAIVDDYNWSAVREGTRQAFRELNYSILFDQILSNSSGIDKQSWWNGLYVAVIAK